MGIWDNWGGSSRSDDAPSHGGSSSSKDWCEETKNDRDASYDDKRSHDTDSNNPFSN